MEAVKQSGHALAYASDELRIITTLAMDAVKQSGSALEFASVELKNNYDIVLEAVKQNGSALRYASVKLRNNYDSHGSDQAKWLCVAVCKCETEKQLRPRLKRSSKMGLRWNLQAWN